MKIFLIKKKEKKGAGERKLFSYNILTKIAGKFWQVPILMIG